MALFQQLGFKLSVSLLIILLISIGVMLYSSLSDLQREITRHEERNMQNKIDNITVFLENNLQHQLNLGNSLNSITEIVSVLNAEIEAEPVNDILAAIKEANVNVMGIRVIDRNGIIIATSDDGIGTDLADRDYFLAGMQGEQFVSEVAVSRVTGDLFYAVASPVYDGARTIGVVSLVIDWGTMVDYLNTDQQTNLSGVTLIIDGQGRYLAQHNLPDVELLEDDIFSSSFGEKVISADSGLIRQQEDDHKLWIAFRKLQTVDWHVITYDREDTILAAVRATRVKNIAILVIILLVIGAFIFFFINRMVTRPLNNVKNYINELEKGKSDFQLKLTNKDEISQIIGAFIDSISMMSLNLENTMRNSKETGMEVNAASCTMATAAEEMSTSLQEFAVSVNDFSDNAHTLRDNIKGVSDDGQVLTGQARDGEGTINNAVGQMENISTVIEGIRGDISELDVRFQEIGKIVATIIGISEQTNLLALNAAIEAARAGDQGRGFAVVSEEVRKLAEQSSTAASEITGLIGQIQQQSQKAVGNVDNGVSQISEGLDVVLATGQKFKTIIQGVENMAKRIEEMALAAEQISSGSEEMSASVEEQSATMDSIAASAQGLQKISTNLADQLTGEIKTCQGD